MGLLVLLSSIRLCGIILHNYFFSKKVLNKHFFTIFVEILMSIKMKILLLTIIGFLENLDFATLIEWVCGGGGLVGIYYGFKYRRENKKMKRDEMVRSATKTQEEQIDLGMKFIKSSQEAVEMIQKTTLNIDQQIQELNKQQDDRISALEKKVDMKMTNMNRSMSSNNKLLRLVVKFLNGSFEEFMKKEAEAKKGGGYEDKRDDETADSRKD